MERFAEWEKTSMESVLRSFLLEHLRRNPRACHKVTDDGKGKTDGFSTADAETVAHGFCKQ